ncbi:Ribosome-binding factor A [Marinobacterium lacunae]|uniref:Ribosome-binding factor A n=1 Tax=Marinobacterium lacunae TaxID=1232683 RepID=A0A081G2A7_9GAMM|nr:30S ribosome-binding factor RbfA [Marinobacterium lacunae]KEA64912.1 Ribosome-binding factor A [Marinobacterium lacunae]MBR9884388.1 30S ribosome-binding factor RbfA [Oceanospirillales bacterium]
MAREFKRTDRVADQIQRDLAVLIQREIKDPRLGMVTISHVKVSKDLGYADIYITVMAFGDQDEAESIAASLKVLNAAAGFLRTELARGIKLRIMPHLRFHFDETVERGRRLHSLIESAYRQEKASQHDDSDSEE